MKRKASLMALKDLMQTVVKPALLASFKMPSETKGDKKLELPKEVDAEEEGCEECDMEGMPKEEETPKGMTISITKLASLERQKDSKKKAKKQ